MLAFIKNLFVAKPPITFAEQLAHECQEAVQRKAVSQANAAFCLQQLEHHEAEIVKAQRLIDYYDRMIAARSKQADQQHMTLARNHHTCS